MNYVHLQSVHFIIKCIKAADVKIAIIFTHTYKQMGQIKLY